MSAYSVIDLSKLDPPDFIEPLNFEQILAEMIADLYSRDPAYLDILESDPTFINLEIAAQRELILRQKINDDARSVLLASARGNDLDQLGAWPYGIERLLISAEDLNAVPPVAAVYETDENYIRRIQLAPEAFTTAGSEASYKFHTLTADADIVDASVTRPTAGEVLVTVLVDDNQGVPDAGTIDAVEIVLNGETVNPICDTVTVAAASVVTYTIDATLTYQVGADQASVLASAIERVNAYKEARRALGLGVNLSGLNSALHVEGVEDVLITSPAAAVTVTPLETAFCTSVAVV